MIDGFYGSDREAGGHLRLGSPTKSLVLTVERSVYNIGDFTQ